MHRPRRLCLLLAAAAFLVGCAPEQTGTQLQAMPAVDPASLLPADERLAALYQQSCRACHAIAAAGAPQTGDRHDWDERWKKGMAALRSNTIRGLNGMPAGGQCFACTPHDYEALITFMAGRGPAQQ